MLYYLLLQEGKKEKGRKMGKTEDYLVSGPINTEKISNLIPFGQGDHEIGAHALFLGQVRADEDEGKNVIKIIYSAYEEMVIEEAQKIEDEIFRMFDDIRQVKILHSIGDVKTGEISMVVSIASGHRGQAFDACKETVEKIKEKLPIWKMEIFDDNSHRWK